LAKLFSLDLTDRLLNQEIAQQIKKSNKFNQKAPHQLKIHKT
jgi:phage FluMu protein Com